MTRWHVLQVFSVALCLAAGYISYNLLQKHLTGSSGNQWFESVCHADAGHGSANCDAVLATPYAYYPPRHDPNDKQAHFPVAFLGMVYYLALGVWLFGIGRLSIQRRWLHIIPLAMVLGGIAASGYFLYIMFAKLDQWCPWCLVTHILNLLLVVSVFLLFPYGDPSKAASKQDGKAATDKKAPPEKKTPADKKVPAGAAVAIAARPYPSARLVVTTLLAMGLMAFGLSQMLGRENYQKAAHSARSSFDQAVKVLRRVQASGPTLRTFWESSPRVKVTIDKDDPVRGPADPTKPYWDVIVFSDFECPSCRNFALYLDQRVRPLFGDQLRVVFKHYPLDSTCNPRTHFRTHPHACDMARLAEAAYLVGGNANFWQLHDYLFTHRDTIVAGKMTPELAAQATGVDVNRLRQVASSDEVQQRIQRDVQEGGVAEVNATPAVYVNGKHVDSLATLSINFWDELANEYWKQAGVPRPEDTALAHFQPTPGTLVPVGGQ